MADSERLTRFLIVCADVPSDAGQVPEVLNEAGCSADIVCRNEGGAMAFDPKRHRGLILMGDGEARASARRYDREREWAQVAIAQGLPVLGICHGAQLLAHLHGGRLSAPHGTANIDEGLGELAITEAGRQDPILRHIAAGAKVYQYHCEMFATPSGAVNLADSGGCIVPHSDAFRIGTNVYGLQFHPELAVPTLVAWLKLSCSDETVERVAAVGRSVLDAWVRLTLAEP